MWSLSKKIKGRNVKGNEFRYRFVRGMIFRTSVSILLYGQIRQSKSERETDGFFRFLVKWIQNPVEKRHCLTSLSLGVASKLDIIRTQQPFYVCFSLGEARQTLCFVTLLSSSVAPHLEICFSNISIN